jgi:hypothetical protein
MMCGKDDVCGFSTAWKLFFGFFHSMEKVIHSVEKVFHSVETFGPFFPQRGKSFPRHGKRIGTTERAAA